MTSNELAVFERLWRKHAARDVFLYAFGLLELDGVDLRRGQSRREKRCLQLAAR